MLEEELKKKEERLAEEKARKLAQEQRLLAGLHAQCARLVWFAVVELGVCSIHVSATGLNRKPQPGVSTRPNVLIC